MSLPPYLLSDPPPTSPLPSKVRLQALYASTSAQRQSNPTGYSANITWWSTLIEELLRSGQLGDDKLVVKVDEGLLGILTWEGGRPKGLGGVVEKLSTSSPPLLHPLPQFRASQNPLHSQASLTSRFIGRPLWWAFSQLNPFGSSEEVVVKEDTLWGKFGKGKEYVHMPLLEQAAAAFTAHIQSNPPASYSESLYSLVSFSEQYASIAFPRRKDGKELPDETLSKRDMEVLIKWLGRDCGVIVSEGDVVKVLAEGENAVDHPITEADKGTVTLRATLGKLEAQILSIEKQIERCQAKAKHHLSLSQKSIALTHLRSKRQSEDLLLRRTSASHQLQSILLSIDQAQGDIELMAAYQSSTSTLKGILRNPLLDLEEVERTTEEMAEVMANQEEVDSAIRVGGQLATKAGGVEEFDEDELKRELEEMVKDEREQSERERQRQPQGQGQGEEEREQEKKEQVNESPAIPSDNKQDGEKSVEPALVSAFAKAPISENQEDRVRRERYEDAQLRQKEEAARAEVERRRRAEKVAAE